MASPLPRQGPYCGSTSDSCTTRAPRAAAISAVPSADAASMTTISSISPIPSRGASASRIAPIVPAVSRQGSTTEMLSRLSRASRAGSKRAPSSERRSIQESTRRSADSPWRTRPSVRPDVRTRTARERTIGMPAADSAPSSAWSSRAVRSGTPPTWRCAATVRPIDAPLKKGCSAPASPVAACRARRRPSRRRIAPGGSPSRSTSISPPIAWAPAPTRSSCRRSQSVAGTESASVVAIRPSGRPTSSSRRAASSMPRRRAGPEPRASTLSRWRRRSGLSSAARRACAAVSSVQASSTRITSNASPGRARWRAERADAVADPLLLVVGRDDHAGAQPRVGRRQRGHDAARSKRSRRKSGHAPVRPTVRSPRASRSSACTASPPWG